jgi:hypothetical protein
MLSSKNLLLTTAILITAIIPITLSASQKQPDRLLEPYKPFLVPAFVLAQGKYLIPAGISYYLIGRKFAKVSHTVSSYSLKKRGHLLMGLGLASAVPWYGMMFSYARQRNNQIQLKEVIQEKDQRIKPHKT